MIPQTVKQMECHVGPADMCIRKDPQDTLVHTLESQLHNHNEIIYLIFPYYFQLLFN